MLSGPGALWFLTLPRIFYSSVMVTGCMETGLSVWMGCVLPVYGCGGGHQWLLAKYSAKVPACEKVLTTSPLLFLGEMLLPV